METNEQIYNENVSIILPTYNRAKSLGNAIQSVLEQTYTAFELLVIDDGSLDETERIVKMFDDVRIRYFKMPENGGQSKARNYGMQQAQYDYLAFEDSDDLWFPEKLECQMQAIQGTDEAVGFVYHKLRYELGENRCMTLPDEKIAAEKKSGDIYAQLLWDNLIGMPTLLMKKECLKKIGGMDETLHCLEDYDFVLRLGKHYKGIFLNRVLLKAGLSDVGVSGDSYQYLIASCLLIAKYKQDYLAMDALNHRLEIILRDADRLGIRDKIIQLLEKALQS